MVTRTPKITEQYDVVVIGSGFGGSVAALRLTEKGYRVLVLEAGSRFADQDFAKNSWNLKKYLYFPRLGLRGIQRIDLLSNVLIMSGAGVGGGSLVYANTLYRPPTEFFNTGSWAGMRDWQNDLAPHYRTAERMLGVVQNPYFSPADLVLKRAAERGGYGDSFRLTPVGVTFDVPADAPGGDPHFGGVGPSRSACINCGECMTGCRHGAKNTLVKNYLYFAEKAGATVIPDTTVQRIEQLDPSDAAAGYRLHLRPSSAGPRARRGAHVIEAPQVIVAAGALGTAKLLQRSRAAGGLPGISEKLGYLSRTNSESLLGVVANNDDHDFSLGSAITSSVYPSADTHVESVRYGRGSGFMGMLQSVLASGKSGDPDRDRPNPLRLVWATIRSGLRLPSFYNLRRWPERTLILLVMQSRDNSLITFLKRGLFGNRLTSRQGHGEANPSWVPAGHELARSIADDIGATPGAVVGEPFGIPLTAHFMGGCVIAPSAQEGVVDEFLRVHGQPGLHIWDGSTLSANPGVNPSLTITAQAEWAAASWPQCSNPNS
ncbi:MAG: FAD-dependent oxidoreductase [Micrococcales bacterium]